MPAAALLAPRPSAALTRRRFTQAAAALALPMSTHRAHAAARLRFTLDWRIDGPGALVLLAQGRGYFAQEQLDVAIDAGAGSTAALQRIAGGTHDIGFADTAALVEFQAANPASVRMQAVYMLLERTPATVFALKKSGIRTPADLQGRNLGAPVFDAGRKAFPLFARANGLDPARVRWTNADPALRETLLARGDLDAITGFYYTSVLNLEARGVAEDALTVFRFADHGVDLYGNAVMVSEPLARQQPEVVRAFLRALTRGIQDVVADPKAAIGYVKTREPILDAAIEERRLRYFLEHFVATPAVRANGLGGIDTQRLGRNIAQITEAYGLAGTVDTAAVFNPAFLPALPARRL